MPGFAEGVERHQVAVYLGALAAGAVAGRAAPAGAWLEHAITPVLAVLLYVTFLQVPVAELGRALRAGRFLAAALVLNFAVVPLVVAAMLAFLPADQAVRLGVLLVLLTPCVDYVIVFSGLAGGDTRRLLAATPVLLLAQMLLLPAYLLLFADVDLADPRPFAEAFVVLIAIPLALAWLTQRSRRVAATAGTTMVPLMAVTLFAVVASQLPKVDDLARVAGAVPFYVAFLLVMPFLGLGVAKAFRLDVPGSRALVFTGATRNSLVVLPLALALPGDAAAVVVAQTLVEVVGMVAYVRVVPRLVASGG
ncbi:arsenic resistance protein [Lentzea sp. NPDC060358]|uniref:arsenic resistance protein n=1 Tax=Lentzea sp. NPDC060358 TaxID=3347103 RepID=UPI00364B9CC6